MQTQSVAHADKHSNTNADSGNWNLSIKPPINGAGAGGGSRPESRRPFTRYNSFVISTESSSGPASDGVKLNQVGLLAIPSARLIN